MFMVSIQGNRNPNLPKHPILVCKHGRTDAHSDLCGISPLTQALLKSTSQ